MLKPLLSLASASPKGAQGDLAALTDPQEACPKPHPPGALAVFWCPSNQMWAICTESGRTARCSEQQTQGGPGPPPGQTTGAGPQAAERASSQKPAHTLHPTLDEKHHGTPGPRVCPYPRTARPPLRTIFRFNGDCMNFPGTLLERLKVWREGFPLGTPTFPGCTNFQSVLFLEQWSQLLPRAGQAHWLKNLAEPPPLANTLAAGATAWGTQGPSHSIPRGVAAA